MEQAWETICFTYPAVYLGEKSEYKINDKWKNGVSNQKGYLGL